MVQRVTGKSLRQFAAEQIFGPLGMTNSHYHDDHNEPVKGRAFAYRPIAGKPGAWTIDVWNNDIVGQGGLMTTVEDLQRWDENFYTGSVGGRGFRAPARARQVERRHGAAIRLSACRSAPTAASPWSNTAAAPAATALRSRAFRRSTPAW